MGMDSQMAMQVFRAREDAPTVVTLQVCWLVIAVHRSILVIALHLSIHSRRCDEDHS